MSTKAKKLFNALSPATPLDKTWIDSTLPVMIYAGDKYIPFLITIREDFNKLKSDIAGVIAENWNFELRVGFKKKEQWGQILLCEENMTVILRMLKTMGAVDVFSVVKGPGSGP